MKYFQALEKRIAKKYTKDEDFAKVLGQQKCRLLSGFLNLQKQPALSLSAVQLHRMLARFVEHDVRPAFLRQVQIHAVGHEIGEVAACVDGEIARVGFLAQRRFRVFRRPSDLFVHYLAQLLGNGLFCVTGANSNTFLRAFHCIGRIQF